MLLYMVAYINEGPSCLISKTWNLTRAQLHDQVCYQLVTWDTNDNNCDINNVIMWLSLWLDVLIILHQFPLFHHWFCSLTFMTRISSKFHLKYSLEKVKLSFYWSAGAIINHITWRAPIRTSQQINLIPRLQRSHHNNHMQGNIPIACEVIHNRCESTTTIICRAIFPLHVKSSTIDVNLPQQSYAGQYSHGMWSHPQSMWIHCTYILHLFSFSLPKSWILQSITGHNVNHSVSDILISREGYIAVTMWQWSDWSV